MPNSATVRTLVTGQGWMGAGVGSIDTALEELLLAAKRELIILAYAIGTNADAFLDRIRQRLGAGVRVTMVVDHLADRHGHVLPRLQELARDYPGQCMIYDFSGDGSDVHLHAKVVIADRQRALVGSANLSWHGLVTNHELAVLVDGPAVSDMALATDRLLNHRCVQRLAG